MSSPNYIFDLLRQRSGGLAGLARHLGISRPVVYRWEKQGDEYPPRRAGQVPAELVIQIEEFTGIPREELRPDLYR